MEMLAKDKHSSLLRKSENYGRDKFYSTGPRKLNKILPNFGKKVAQKPKYLHQSLI
jgi:hypothetical protein